jgi:anti-sigma regulatory factor (Ser/Thr protein kinase)
VLLGVQPIDGIDPLSPSFHLELKPDPSAARLARRFVAEHLSDVDQADALSLLTSEVVTNGVLHARTSLLLGATVGRDRLLVTVADHSAGSPRQPPPDNDRPSGRGLMLVDALASQWGVLENDGGKTVWFTLPRVGPDAHRTGAA